jgi:integrase
VKLTKRTIDALTYQGEGNAAFYVWDDEIKGFGLRIYPTGRKAFVVKYRTNSRRQRLPVLGTFGRDLTLDEARRRAREVLGDVARGLDPSEEKERERQGETVRALCAAYMQRHGNAKKSGKDDQRRIDRHILPNWGNLKATALRRADVAALHVKIGTTARYEANRMVALVSKMFELARRWGFVPEDHPNPARGVDHFREEKRDRWITPEELPRLARAINQEPNESARFALWLYLLTGARKSELLRARWDDVSFERAELRLADTKAGRTHYIPLSSPAMALLQQIPRRAGNPHVFPGRELTPEFQRDPAPLVNIAKAWNRVRKAAGVEDVRLHDLRRTVGSWLAQAGNSLHLIGRVLNHSNVSTTQVYARFGEDHVRAALEQHGARIMGAAGLTPAAEVLDIKQRTAK